MKVILVIHKKLESSILLLLYIFHKSVSPQEHSYTK